MAGPWIDLDFSTAFFYLAWDGVTPSGKVENGQIVKNDVYQPNFSFPGLAIGDLLEPTKHYDIELTFAAAPQDWSYVDLIETMDEAGANNYDKVVESPGNWYTPLVTNTMIVGPGQNSWDYARWLGSGVLRFWTPTNSALVSVRYRESDYVIPTWPDTGTQGGSTSEAAAPAVINGDTDWQNLSKFRDPEPYPYWGLWWTFTAPVDGLMDVTPLRRYSRINNNSGAATYVYRKDGNGDLQHVADAWNGGKVELTVKAGETYWVTVGADDWENDVIAVGLRTQVYQYEYTDWMRDPDYTVQAFAGFASLGTTSTDQLIRRVSRGYYEDPGTPQAPNGKPELVNMVIDEAEAGTTKVHGNGGGGYRISINQTGGVFGGPTIYTAIRDYNPLAFSVRGRNFWVPTVPPGYIGYEAEDGKNTAKPIKLTWYSNTLADNMEGCVAQWITNFRAYRPSRYGGSGSNIRPHYDPDVEGEDGDIVLALPSGSAAVYPNYQSFTFPSPIDLTPYMDTDHEDDGAVIVVRETEKVGYPSDYDTTESSFGFATSGTADGLVEYVLRPPRYRLIKSKVPWEEPKPVKKGGWTVGGVGF